MATRSHVSRSHDQIAVAKGKKKTRAQKNPTQKNPIRQPRDGATAMGALHPTLTDR